MKTQIKKSGDTIVVEVNGKLDFETQQPFKEDLRRLIQSAKTDSVPTQIIFNLEKLEFVGSSGISGFVQTLKDFNAAAPIEHTNVIDLDNSWFSHKNLLDQNFIVRRSIPIACRGFCNIM